jgi:hypothetical protein
VLAEAVDEVLEGGAVGGDAGDAHDVGFFFGRGGSGGGVLVGFGSGGLGGEGFPAGVDVDVFEAVGAGEAVGDILEERQEHFVVHELFNFLHLVGESLAVGDDALGLQECGGMLVDLCEQVAFDGGLAVLPEEGVGDAGEGDGGGEADADEPALEVSFLGDLKAVVKRD